MKQLTRHLLLATAMSGLAACAGLPEKATPQARALPEAGGEQQSQQALGPYEKGKRSLEQGDVGRAIEYFLIAHRREPESLEGINALAISYDMLGRPDLADRYFAKALALAPREPDILNNLGYAMLKRGDTQRARQYLLEAKALSSENEVILSNLAVLQAPSDIQEDVGQLARAEEPVLQETFSAELATSLAPVPLAVVDEVPVTESVNAAEATEEPESPPEAPEKPVFLAAALPAGAREEQQSAMSSDEITWLSERQTPEPDSLQTAELGLPGETPAETVAWNGPRVSPSNVQVAETRMAARPPIALLRRSSMTEVESDGDPGVQRPREADLIAALPATPESNPESILDAVQEAPAVLPLSATPLSGSADETAPKPQRAADLPCDGDLDGLRVTLVNGNGREGMAARTREQLSLMGLTGQARLQNADRYSYMSSTISYSGEFACEAQALASLLLGKPTLKREEGLAEDLRVLLGGDLLDFDARYVQNLK
jgi:Flp pilus assembly protein TadD